MAPRLAVICLPAFLLLAAFGLLVDARLSRALVWRCRPRAPGVAKVQLLYKF